MHDDRSNVAISRPCMCQPKGSRSCPQPVIQGYIRTLTRKKICCPGSWHFDQMEAWNIGNFRTLSSQVKSSGPVFFPAWVIVNNIFVAPISVLYASIPDQQHTTEPSLASPSASRGSRRPTPSHHWTQAPQSQRSPSPATIAAPASSRLPTWTVKVAGNLTVPCERRALTSIWQDG